MRFVFTKLFYFLAALAFIPLVLAWDHPWLRWVALGYNILLLSAAFVESRFCQLPGGLTICRLCDKGVCRDDGTCPVVARLQQQGIPITPVAAEPPTD